jgi:hypothetical protein
MNVSFEEFTELLHDGYDIKDAEICVISSDQDSADQTVTIT